MPFPVKFIRFEFQDPNFEFTDADINKEQHPFQNLRELLNSGEDYKDP
ncbi:hypothetical protein GWO63_010400 [Corynebacterium macginleyi]|uniref:Uncharacterized protein n=1 Tax=Corynebacterium macginleyi TaxID=38290 RepID=A0ABS1Y8A3_9CORY|nr:hypothetical protein [Corynebacterium macginleyi]MBM0244638.1 hypothetical protein [Corynebacterium macginleyi]